MRRQYQLMCAIGALGLTGLAIQANAATVDLITNTTGSISGAIFSRDDLQSAGTGVLDSFVRIDAAGPEETSQGYNTSARPVFYDELTDPNFTRDLQFGEIPTVDFMGTFYKQFFLDLNEPRGGKEFLSLDLVNIYSNPTAHLTTFDESLLGTLRYTLGALGVNVVLLDFTLSHGSGQANMELLVPLANFGGVQNSDFIYLYSAFGNFMFPDFAEENGFEEWSIRTADAPPPPPVIPLPSAAGMGLLGLGGLVLTRRRRS